MAARATRRSAIPGSFDEAFDDLLARAYSLALAMVGDALLAEELTVEALARTRVDWSRVVRRGRADGYVARQITLLAIDAVARREPVLPIDTPPAADRDESDDGYERAERASDAIRLRHDEARALRALPRRRREIVALWCFAGCTKPDVAEMLGITTLVVDTELELARVPLQQALVDAASEARP
jgi:DNA-directed RNA polymerase specialized sigma24 family protein